MKGTTSVKKLSISVFLQLVALACWAQPVPPTTNPLDGATPHALKAAEPSSTYPLSNLDEINYYNGTVSFTLPLLSIGGRGEVSHTVLLGIKPPQYSVDASFNSDDTSINGTNARYFDTQGHLNGYHPYDPGYGPGILMVKSSVALPIACSGSNPSYVYQQSFVHLVYATSGGAEYELYDQNFGFGGGLLTSDSADCGPAPGYDPGRGTTFKDRNGQGLWFEATGPIYDAFVVPPAGGGDATFPSISISGTLYFPDGSRSIIDNGRTMSKIDRNGNTISFQYGGVSGTDVSQVTDALGRTYTFEYDVSDGSYGTVDKITYYANDSSTKQHVIRISYASNAPAAGAFPDMPCCSGSVVRQPVAVYLPNATPQTPSYQFSYDAYAELQQVTLPTGAKISYSYGPGVDCQNVQGCYSSGQMLQDASSAGMSLNADRPDWTPVIYRRLLTRTEYADGVNATRSTQISQPERAISSGTTQHISKGTLGALANFISSITIRTKPYVEVTESGVGMLPAVTRHYFYGVSEYTTNDSSLIYSKLDSASGYVDTDPSTWSNLAGAAQELLSRTATDGIHGYPDRYTTKEFRTEVPGLQLTDFAFGPAGTGIAACQKVVTISDSRITATTTSGQVMAYDSGDVANRTDLYEYDYGNAPALTTTYAGAPFQDYYRRTCSAAATGYTRHVKTGFDKDSAYVSLPAHLLDLVTQAQVLTGANSLVSEADYAYDETAPNNIAGLNQWTAPVMADGVTPRTKVGNVTSVTQLLADLWQESGFNNSPTSVRETRAYDNAGNITQVVDRRGNTSAYDWSDNCTGTTPSSVLGAFLKRITWPSVNGVGLTQSWSYDCFLGRPVSFTDRDGATLTFAYETSGTLFGRLLSVKRSDFAGRTFVYTDPPSALAVETHSDVLQTGSATALGDQKLYVRSEYDGFGRLVKTKSGVSGTYLLETARDLDGLGRLLNEYLPRPAGSTGPYRQMAYDALGRLTQITNSADLTTITHDYSLNVVSSKDEASVQTKRTTDAFGRLIEVVEDPNATSYTGLNYITDYTYDELDNLKTVTQGSAQQRAFQYDSLKRLRRAYNPERGVERYQYDNNGNLTSRTEPDSTAVTLAYDVLNRLTSKTYSGTAAAITASAAWCYEGKSYAYTNSTDQCVGSIAQASYGKVTGYGSRFSSMKYEHDTVGRISASEQRTPPSANPYRFTYAHYANDSVATTTYPSSKAIATCYDGLGRAIWVSKTKTQSDCVNNASLTSADGYAMGAVYAPHGALAGLQFGNGLVETTDYNARQQPDWIALGTGTPSTSNGSVFYESYSYGTQNNGNIQQVTLQLPGGTNVNRMLAYDKVNRLQAAMEDGGALPASAPFCPAGNAGRWCQAFTYDERGNRTVTETGLGTNPVNIGSFATTNRIADFNWEYDGRGNIQAAPLNTGSTPKDRYLFDAEDRLRVACPSAGTSELCNNDTPSTGRILYDYDPEGHRVRRSGASVSEVVYVYDRSGQLTAEYGGDTQTAGVKYLTTDYLGSTRVLTDVNTNAIGRYDYLPFGESLGVSSGNPRFGIAGYGPVDQSVRLRFTSKERDAETGLDFFGARYFSGAQGRFTSPDWSGAPQPIPFADLPDPQTLNLYSYVRNNPLKTRDEDGHCDWCQKLGNYLGGNGWHTDAEALLIEALHARFASSRLIEQGVDRNFVNSLSNADVIGIYNAFQRGDSSWNGYQLQYDSVPPGPSGPGLRYEPNEGKHGPTARQGPRGTISPEPTNGQQVLQDSVPIKETSSARVGVDKSTGEYVVFREQRPGTFHGYAYKNFNELPNEAKAALQASGKVSQSGAIK
jgi:RHS repeat-associated protein